MVRFRTDGYTDDMGEWRTLTLDDTSDVNEDDGNNYWITFTGIVEDISADLWVVSDDGDRMTIKGLVWGGVDEMRINGTIHDFRVSPTLENEFRGKTTILLDGQEVSWRDVPDTSGTDGGTDDSDGDVDGGGPDDGTDESLLTRQEKIALGALGAAAVWWLG